MRENFTEEKLRVLHNSLGLILGVLAFDELIFETGIKRFGSQHLPYEFEVTNSELLVFLFQVTIKFRSGKIIVENIIKVKGNLINLKI